MYQDKSSTRGVKSLAAYFAVHPVFTNGEITAWLSQFYSDNKRTQESLLRYHIQTGNLVRVRRGLYVAVHPGSTKGTVVVNPLLIAGKLTEDAVIAYHTALEFHGKAHSQFECSYIQSTGPIQPTVFQAHRYECFPFPKALKVKGKEHVATKLVEISGVEVRVATLERTMVDVLDRPVLGGGLEEIWRSLESVEFFDLDVVLEYALLLDNATTVAKVGYFLDQHAKGLMVEDRHLALLREHRPKQLHYLERGKKGRVVSEWNLVVPPSLIDRTWEEIA